jgi:hypothetical protein
MRRKTVLALILLAALGAERRGVRADLPERSERILSYTIRARLDPALKEVRGDMDLVWRNASAKPIGEIYLHLYLNAFKDGSTFLREGDTNGKAGARWDDEYPGFARIDKLRAADDADLLPGLSFVQPDDGNEKDETLAVLKLPSPVPPQETLSLKVGFTSRLPRVFARTGWSGDPEDPSSLFFMVAQWFPKVAALLRDEQGEPRWDTHQFHRNTEFFSDYGTYLVSITVPEGYVVGATGKGSDPAKNDDGTVTTTFQQDDVHDFAWTASPRFRTADFTWAFDSFCEDVPKLGVKLHDLLARTAEHRGLDPSQVKPANAVAVRILYQADHEGLVGRIRNAVGAALACYGMWFGAYPYPTLTIVDPPSGGRAAGGMEYPTLITIFADANAPDYATWLEAVTIHEFGHQFFYGLLGSNEFEESWLDEGFTSFTDARVHEIAIGPATETVRYGPFTFARFRPFEAPSVYDRLRTLLRLGGTIDALPHPWKKPDSLLPVPEGNAFWDYARDMPALHFDKRVPIPQPFDDRNGYLRSGTRDAMVLKGWEFADRSDYRANSYPKPSILLYTLRGLMGEASFDKAMYAYAEKYRFRHPTTEDFLAVIKDHDAEAARFLGTMVETAERFDAAILEAKDRKLEAGGAGGAKWEWTIKVQRRGAVELPIEIRANDELLETWHSHGRETTKTFRFVREQPLKEVRLGPSWLAVIDEDLSNNARSVEPDALPAATLAARWTFYVEDLVRSYAGVAR